MYVSLQCRRSFNTDCPPGFKGVLFAWQSAVGKQPAARTPNATLRRSILPSCGFRRCEGHSTRVSKLEAGHARVCSSLLRVSSTSRQTLLVCTDKKGRCHSTIMRHQRPRRPQRGGGSAHNHDSAGANRAIRALPLSSRPLCFGTALGLSYAVHEYHMSDPWMRSLTSLPNRQNLPNPGRVTDRHLFYTCRSGSIVPPFVVPSPF